MTIIGRALNGFHRHGIRFVIMMIAIAMIVNRREDNVIVFEFKFEQRIMYLAWPRQGNDKETKKMTRIYR